MKLWKAVLPIAALALSACGGDGDDENEMEVITTINLTFTPVGGGTPVTASFADPDGDGGNAPMVDGIVLANGTNYTLGIEFLNELETPAEDITEEIMEEDDEHQIFITGTAVSGPATGTNASAVVTHAYADMDGNGDPVGLSNTINTLGVGMGTFDLVLRHLPPVGGTAVKTSTLAADVAAGGITALPGDSDVDVSFMLDVQ